ncbi:MAG: sodium-dependent transporter [Alphaproteobacteria bacterium]|nr:sodium-dependent transporter [Alphaproteobacteria bacterium]
MTIAGRVDRKTETWSSRFGFIMAAVGSSVGLGNIWRFTYTTGENGGGAFILAYLVCMVLAAFPLLCAEYAIGRRSGHSAVESVQALARASGKSELWGVVAWVGSLTAFFILTFYCVVSSWLMAYAPLAFSGVFSADAGPGALEASEARFDTVTSNIPLMLLCLAVFIAAAAFVVGRGVRRGIERASMILMPVFILILLVLLGFAAADGALGKAAAFLTSVRPQDFSFGMVLGALSQSFFATGVGAAVMITYGAYMKPGTDIPGSAAIVAGADTAVALIAALTVFSLVFAVGSAPDAGYSLFFVNLPIGLGAMPGGAIIGGAFFLLALFAALASSISLMEVAVSWLDERTGVTRWGAALGVGFTVFVTGAGYIFSRQYITFVDFVASSLMMPLGGFLVALFCGWVIERKMMQAELGPRFFRVWGVLVRWVIPIFVGLVLVLGALDRLQNRGWVQLPAALTGLLGPNVPAT